MKCLVKSLSLLVSLLVTTVSTFSMKDVGITDDIHRVACSLNDMFKESFELMIGSLGKHGVYSLPEIRQTLDHHQTGVQFIASNGWLKFPKLRAAEGIRTGALRKYMMPLPDSKEVLLACVKCLEISAEGVNYCYEATSGRHNVSGTIGSGPVIYSLSLELRVSQSLGAVPVCNVSLGQRSLELSERSDLHSESRGLRTLNYLADNIDGWLHDHLNTVVRDQLEHRLLASFHRVLAKHDVCAELITK